ncbi:flagellar biosynthesis protein FlhB [uncultured Tyzzerella sp.]|uniref:flagellar biosynthesis protein FlhB n=1 Tax=uncultured Tyzzerella sp. TaxID=2321398 RepID=UPI002942BE06|nr:flagellar biosynthesis protein FlhB [uncultured Tyzzerella sp.]
MIVSKVKDNNSFYININLSFFDGEKTEKATPKKKQKARSEGQVAISKEIATAITLILGFLSLKVLGKFMYKQIASVMNFNFTLIEDANNIISQDYLLDLFIYLITRCIIIAGPICIIAMLIGIVTNLLQVGWHPTTKPLKPKFDAFNPATGFKRLFSFKQVVDAVIAIIKLVFLTIVIYNSAKGEVYQLRNIIYMDLFSAVLYISNLCVDIGLKVGYFFIIIAIIDFVYQKYSHNKKLRMSKKEVKDEYKEVEGDPIIKSKIRQKMRESSLRRMMQEVPTADVVITNPTHFAVAIKYDREKEGAPIVLAKGVDHLAQKIKNVAKENKVEIVENKPLARALYSTVDVGKEIPPELYQAVAEVLAFVYKLKNMV